ncbi:MAG: hypothetical protein KKD73_03965 [Proteobacteria bacterium]|nr:hypothetical protein [Pseudomonadota bacterium]MBU1639723.1 hypothetical protein [Pseudomonadota bacterium]
MGDIGAIDFFDLGRRCSLPEKYASQSIFSIVQTGQGNDKKILAEISSFQKVMAWRTDAQFSRSSHSAGGFFLAIFKQSF